LPALVVQEVDWLRRFEQETFAASALNHPKRSLSCYDFGEVLGHGNQR
jgi:hypothetical protein